jgi:diaminopimelate epimerase
MTSNEELISEARGAASFYASASNDDLVDRLADALEAASQAHERANVTIARAIQAHLDMHLTYGNTSACRSGIGGSAMTAHCAVICDSPVHAAARKAWEQVEIEYRASLYTPPAAGEEAGR